MQPIEEDHIVKPFIYGKDICEFADSIASIRLMKEWINDCESAPLQNPPELRCEPTRLIQIGENDLKAHRLCSPKRFVQYAALSYRWGLGKQSETTKENVNERSRELLTSDFPKTLQDAIQVTRGLGLKYIWIDQICIVQDDEEEWAKEAALMADIYADAYIVLSATATEDSKSGFLQKRPEPLDISYAQHGYGDRKVRARRVDNHSCDRDDQKTSYTLFQRGWCMQERFLARRIIHFLPDEFLFECEHGRRCECGAANTERPNSDRLGFKAFKSLQAALIMPENFTSEWMKIVGDYSQTELTYGQDSLPALSGIAACMEHLSPGKYIAGLWEHGIIFQLGWRYAGSPIKIRWKRPENADILGPTFAWSSHERNVHFYYPVELSKEICTLESFQVQAATSNPYGRVLHASLCLSGRSVSGYRVYQQLKTSAFGKAYTHMMLDSGLLLSDSPHWTMVLDDEQQDLLNNETTWRSVVCFGLSSYCGTLQEVESVDALLLEHSETRVGEYTRLGVVQSVERSWFDENTVASRITLV